jgi:hypothetical protein
LKKGKRLYDIYFPSDLFDMWRRAADQQQLVMKARYEALASAEEGGARAVKKAILKKQKKVGQRSRPYKKRKGRVVA